MFTLEGQPPAPTSLTSIPPPTSPANLRIDQAHLPDVNASPLYAYVPHPRGTWENYNRRDLILSARGEWKLLAAQTITPETPFREETTIEEGIVSTESVERSFATDIGVTAGIPKIGLGASISTSLSITTGRSIQISDNTTQTRILTATTTEPGGQVFWFWQLEVIYVVTGKMATWRLTPNGVVQLIKDGRNVLTLDGEGRELNSGKQVPGAFRVAGFQDLKNEMQVNSTIFVTTQFPKGSSPKVMLTDAQDQSTEIPTYDALMSRGAVLLT